MIFLETRGVGKSYSGTVVLNNITFSVAPHTVHGLVGENGAGKSTLGKIVSGVTRPDTGELLIDGKRVRINTPRQAAQYGIAVISQEQTLAPQQSVLRNVFLGAEHIHGGILDKRGMRRTFAELCAQANFEVPADATVSELGVADQGKVEILRVLNRRPRVIVMDEPTAAFTRSDTEQLLALVQALRASDVGIVYISHNLADVIKISDRITVLRDGSVVAEEESASATPAGLIEKMIGRPLGTMFPAKSQPSPTPVAMKVTEPTGTGAVRTLLEVKEGEILGIGGLVGSGRSTLLREIFGVESHRQLSTWLARGRRLRRPTPGASMRAGLVLIPESRKSEGLNLGRPITHNLTMAFPNAASRWGVVRRHTERAETRRELRKVGVDVRDIGRPVSTLSGGNQQRVMFAKWLRGAPKVLLIDEPTRGVDVGAKQGIYKLIVDAAAAGSAIVLVSSDHEELIGLAHRILVMSKGRIVRELNAISATEQAIVTASFEIAPEREQ
jgi:ABC-type sugar transport system ATPase subunit